MADNIGVAGPSQPKKRKSSNIVRDEELLRILEESDFEDCDEYDDDDELYCPSSEEESDECHFEVQEELEDEAGTEDIDLSQPIVDNDNVVWQNDPVGMVNHPFVKSERLLIQPVENTPLAFFRLLLTDDFLMKIVEETNLNAVEIFCTQGVSEQSRISNWKDMTIDELLTFLGIYLHTGNIKINRLQDYWKKDPLFRVQAIADSMSRNRFLLILRALHFSRNPGPQEERPADRLYKIRPIIEFFNERMCQVYYPGRELSLDESMVLWRGRLLFRQYIKNKKHKYGIKLYVLTTPTGMVQKFAVYTGMLDDMGGANHTEKVVLHLLNEKLDVGHHIYMDNYYNSYALAKILLDRKTHCTGTLRSRRKNNPKEVQSAKLKKGETVARYANGIMIGKWRDKREVLYISTEFENNMVDSENRRKEIKSKPWPLVNYNKYMSGVDRQDQMLSYYLSERKTLRWYKKLFIHVVEMMIINSHALYNKYSGERISLYEFRLSIIRGLLPPIEIQRRRNPDAHVMIKREGLGGARPQRRRCKSCSSQGKRTETLYECQDCPETPGFCLNCCIIQHK